jgi:hypothetical protein
MPKSDSSFNPDGYAPVADRIQLFYDRFPSGRIITELMSRDGGEIVFRALVYREVAEPEPAATGWAAEREGDGDVNAVACLENTETSAVGRALANLGFTASAKRPSREEMAKADRARRRLTLPAPAAAGGSALQTRANAVHDLLELVALAERKGLSPWRAEVIRGRLSDAQPLPLTRVRRLELVLRAWLRRQRM